MGLLGPRKNRVLNLFPGANPGGTYLDPNIRAMVKKGGVSPFYELESCEKVALLLKVVVHKSRKLWTTTSKVVSKRVFNA